VVLDPAAHRLRTNVLVTVAGGWPGEVKVAVAFTATRFACLRALRPAAVSLSLTVLRWADVNLTVADAISTRFAVVVYQRTVSVPARGAAKVVLDPRLSSADSFGGLAVGSVPVRALRIAAGLEPGGGGVGAGVAVAFGAGAVRVGSAEAAGAGVPSQSGSVPGWLGGQTGRSALGPAGPISAWPHDGSLPPAISR